MTIRELFSVLVSSGTHDGEQGGQTVGETAEASKADVVSELETARETAAETAGEGSIIVRMIDVTIRAVKLYDGESDAEFIQKIMAEVTNTES